MSLADAIVSIAPSVQEICVAQGAGFFRDNVIIELRPSHLETNNFPGGYQCSSSNPYQASIPRKSMKSAPMKLTPAGDIPKAHGNENAPTVAITVVKAKSDVTITDFRFRCTLKGMQYIPMLDCGEEANYVNRNTDAFIGNFKDYKAQFEDIAQDQTMWFSKGIVSTKLGFVFVHKEEDEDLSSHQVQIDGIPVAIPDMPEGRWPGRDWPLYTSQGRVICGWYGKLNGWNEPAKDLALGSMEPFKLKTGDEIQLIYKALVEQKIPKFASGGSTSTIPYPKFDMTGALCYKSISSF